MPEKAPRPIGVSWQRTAIEHELARHEATLGTFLTVANHKRREPAVKAYIGNPESVVSSSFGRWRDRIGSVPPGAPDTIEDAARDLHRRDLATANRYRRGVRMAEKGEGRTVVTVFLRDLIAEERAHIDDLQERLDAKYPWEQEQSQ